MKYYAKITTQFEGYHRWIDAPEKVAFLRNKHRHMFHITVWIEQSHDDRDVEYIMTKWDLNALVERMKVDLVPYQQGTASCEMMAEYLYYEIVGSVLKKEADVKVEITEDGENGALVTL